MKDKDIDKRTSYMPISLLSVIAKTLEKSLLPYITANTPTQHGYKTQHSRLTTVNNTVAKGFNQSHILTTSIQNGIPSCAILSPILFNIYTADIPPLRTPVNVLAYVDDITITYPHTSTSAANKYIEPYLHTVFARTKQNNLTLNPDKTTCTLFTPDPAEYKSNLDLKINNTALPMATHPNVLCLTFDPKLTYNTHIHNIAVQAHKPQQMIKTVTTTGWGKQKETLMVTYKAVMRTALDYVSSIWYLASSTSIHKRQVMQNSALRTVSVCTPDTNIQHRHDETLILPIHKQLQLHTSQYKQKPQHPSHPLHKHTTHFNTSRLKSSILNNGCYTTNIPTDSHTVTTPDIKTNMCHIHTSIVSMHRGNNKILRTPQPHISRSEEMLPSLTRRTLAILRTNKPPFLKSYLHKVDARIHPSPPVRLTHTTYIMSSTAPTYAPHCHPWICGQIPPV